MTSKQYCSLLVRFGIGQGLLAAMFAAVQVKLSSVRPRPTFIWIGRLPWQHYGPVIAGRDWVAILVNTFLVACFVAAIVRGGCEAWLRTSDRVWGALCLLELFVVVSAVPYLTVQHHAAFVWCWY
jgi:ABC-type spermidine/putrescine transport system permease subunit II